MPEKREKVGNGKSKGEVLSDLFWNALIVYGTPLLVSIFEYLISIVTPVQYKGY